MTGARRGVPEGRAGERRRAQERAHRHTTPHPLLEDRLRHSQTDFGVQASGRAAARGAAIIVDFWPLFSRALRTTRRRPI